MNPVTLPAAGLHRGISFEDYTAWPAANFSTIKLMDQTASKCKHAIDNPKKPTPAMILGSALHIATLEPARFENSFHICPPCDRRTKEGKEIFSKAEKDAAGKLLIRDTGSADDATPKGLQLLRGMAKSIRAMNAAAQFLDGAGQNEVSALWKDEITGLWCKGRFDRYIENHRELGQFIIELKSDRAADDWNFGKTVFSRRYAAQASGYSHGLEIITGKKVTHIFIAVENFAPFDCAIYKLDDPDVQTGYLQYRRMLDRYAECIKTNVWPGYPDKVQVLSMPGYAAETVSD